MEVKAMNKIGISQLASILVDKHELSSVDAERFITLMFDIINDGLQSEKQVKLKKLGTFKVTSVSARESVDVNTGERIMIEGRDKISFVPDATMRDLVNRPFNQFETVVINDGVSFSDIDDNEENSSSNENVNDNDSDDESISIPLNDSENRIDNANANVMVQTLAITPNQLSILNKNVYHEKQTNITIAPEDTEEKETTTQTSNDEVIENEEVVDDSMNEEPQIDNQDSKESTQEKTNPVAKETAAYEEDLAIGREIAAHKAEKDQISYANDEIKEQLHKSRNMIRVLACCICLLIIGAAFATYYVFGLLDKRDKQIENLVTRTINYSKRDVTLQKSNTAKANPSIKINAKRISPIEEKDNSINKDEKKQPAVTEVKNIKKQVSQIPSDKNVSQYDKDPRVRTGAYMIVGIASTVTVKSGQSIASISRTYLGPGMECYLEAVNGESKDIKEGQKIKIPKLELKNKK